MGAWIEIKGYGDEYTVPYVAPGMGAWIEIDLELMLTSPSYRSLPVWERGLKSEPSPPPAL